MSKECELLQHRLPSLSNALVVVRVYDGAKEPLTLAILKTVLECQDLLMGSPLYKARACPDAQILTNWILHSRHRSVLWWEALRRNTALATVLSYVSR
eukprot:3351372-Amphidinium_carterae.1